MVNSYLGGGVGICQSEIHGCKYSMHGSTGHYFRMLLTIAILKVEQYIVIA